MIPADFARSLHRGEAAQVQVVIDAVDANTAQIAQGYLGRALQDYNSSHGANAVAENRPRRMLVRAAHPAPPPRSP